MPKTEDLEEETDEIKTEAGDKEDEEKSPEEDDLNLQDLEFHQFMQPSEITSSPVLEKIASAQERPVFVGGILQGPQTIPGEEKKANEFEYVASSQQDEPKYISSDSRISQETNRLNMMEIGKGQPETFRDVNQQVFLERFSERGFHESSMAEKKWTTGRFDIEKVGRRDPFEVRDVKYEKKYKPDLSSSK